MEQDIEALRAERQAKANAKAARLRARAERLEKEAEAKMAAFNHYRQDWAWVTQPANPNRGFGKQRQQITDRYGKGLELMVEAKTLRERADELERTGGRVKGDAERRHEEQRAANDAVIGVGATVRDFAFGIGTVVRVNKKTYTVEFPSGSRYARDKMFVQLVKAAA